METVNIKYTEEIDLINVEQQCKSSSIDPYITPQMLFVQLHFHNNASLSFAAMALIIISVKLSTCNPTLTFRFSAMLIIYCLNGQV